MRDHGDRAGPPPPPLAVAAAGRAGGRAGPDAGVAACGGGGKSDGVASLSGSNKATATTSAGGSHDDRQAALNFARCMRQHGIDLPDPKITADGIDQPRPSRVDRDIPRLMAAERACHQYGVLPPVKSGGPQSGGGGK
jgi:hypothetical protein